MSMDSMIQRAFPVRTASAEHPLHFLEDGAISYIVARDGLWQDIRSDWLDIRHLVAPAAGVHLPYGAVQHVMNWKCSFPPVSIWREFAEQARLAMPNECAALFVWNQSADTWRLAMREALHASSSRIDYRNPPLGDDEVPVVDIHSHARHPAGFSVIDDADDTGSVKVAAVIGTVDRTVSIALRLCVSGKYYGLQLGADGSFEPRPTGQAEAQ